MTINISLSVRLCTGILAGILSLFTGLSLAQTSDAAEQMTNEQFFQSLHPQSGTITLPGKIATLKLNNKFLYLNPDSAEKLLVDGWGNPPGNDTLGMVIPATINPLDDASWGVVIAYSEDGHINDSDADDIDYNGLLKDMKEQVSEENEARVSEGYPAMSLVGWAEQPTYDKLTHKFYWAKEFSSESSPINSLNYNIRVLGRKGVLVLNAVAGMNQIATIKQEMPSLLEVTEFTDGNRYEDFDSNTDHVAEYGLAVLVAGGVAAKLGVFAKIFAVLLALKKFLIIGVVAVGVFIKKLLSKRPTGSKG